MTQVTVKVLIILGAPGAGKTTRARALCEVPGFRRWPSLSTRAPRDGEVDGFDYEFVDDDAFDDALRQGRLLETVTLPDGTRRGLPAPPATEPGEVLVAIVDVPAVPLVVAQFREGEVAVEHLEVSPEKLAERLRRRGDSEADIAMRLAWGEAGH